MLKLNIGSGATEIPGYTNIDRKNGQEAAPLSYENESVDEIRASHILEHFSHTNTLHVLKEWARVLKIGGVMKIAVPDFDKIVDAYKIGDDLPIEGYLMGGHEDDNDRHYAIFNRQKLFDMMTSVGFENIHEWKSEVNDCASLSISLNLQGTKGIAPIEKKQFKVVAAMSVPRLGFMDNFGCAFSGLHPLGIEILKHTGAFWGQCLERCMTQIVDAGADAILTLDYDSIFTKQDVSELIRLFNEHPEIDALAAMQSNRIRSLPMFTVHKDGVVQNNVPMEDIQADVMKVATAHFGLTLIRVSALNDIKHPWFHGQPNKDGLWDDGRMDDDISFWFKWSQAGKTLYQANHVLAGHAELMIKWPGQDLNAIYQHPSEFYKTGKPAEAWK